MNALLKSDAAKQESALDVTCVDTDDLRRRTDKPGLIASIRPGDLRMNFIKLSDLQVSKSGCDCGGYRPSLIRQQL